MAGNSSNSSGGNADSSNAATNPPTNLSEDVSDKLSKLAEDAENICKIFVPISAVVSALFLFLFNVYDSGYREYFQIGDEWTSELSLSSVFKFVFLMLIVSVIMLPNFLSYSLSNLINYKCNTKKAKVFWYVILICVPLVVMFFVIYLTNLLNESVWYKKLILLAFLLFVIWGIGILMAWNYRPLKSTTESQPDTESQQSPSTTEEGKKVKLHIVSPIIASIILMIWALSAILIYDMGADEAEIKKEFKVIEITDEENKTSTRWVILTEKDDKLLLAELTSEDNGVAEINTKKQRIIENGEYDYDLIEYKKVNVPNKKNDG